MTAVPAKVRMSNPALPGQPIWVYPQAVPVHMAAGWQEDPEPPKPPQPRPGPAPSAGSDTATEAAEDTPKPAGLLRRTPKPPTASEE